MDDGLIDGKSCHGAIPESLVAEPDIALVPIMIDSSKWGDYRSCLTSGSGKCVVNSISLKEGEKTFLQQANWSNAMGLLIVMALMKWGEADIYERRIVIAKRSYDLLVDKVQFPAEDIIFDLNIFPVATGMEEHRRNAIDFIEGTRWVRQNLPHCSVSGGVSNVFFSFRGNDVVREAMHSAFCTMPFRRVWIWELWIRPCWRYTMPFQRICWSMWKM